MSVRGTEEEQLKAEKTASHTLVHSPTVSTDCSLDVALRFGNKMVGPDRPSHSGVCGCPFRVGGSGAAPGLQHETVNAQPYANFRVEWAVLHLTHLTIKFSTIETSVVQRGRITQHVLLLRSGPAKPACFVAKCALGDIMKEALVLPKKSREASLKKII